MSARTTSINELAAALCAAQAEFTAIPKDSTNPFFKSKYATLAQVVEKASPILTTHGLAVSQFPGRDDDGVDTLTTWLLHTSGQFIADSMRLHLVKDDPQGHGSAMTYARRYAYMGVLGLVADEDDDGNKATKEKSRRAPAKVELTEPMNPTMLTTMAVKELKKEVKDAKLTWDVLLGALGIEPGGRLSVVDANRILAELAKGIPVEPERKLTDEELGRVEKALRDAGAEAEVLTRVGAKPGEWTTVDAKRIKQILDERKAAA